MHIENTLVLADPSPVQALLGTHKAPSILSPSSLSPILTFARLFSAPAKTASVGKSAPSTAFLWSFVICFGGATDFWPRKGPRRTAPPRWPAVSLALPFCSKTIIPWPSSESAASARRGIAVVQHIAASGCLGECFPSAGPSPPGWLWHTHLQPSSSRRLTLVRTVHCSHASH